MGGRRRGRGVALAAAVAALLVVLAHVQPAGAVHESINTLVFAPLVDGESALAGDGVVEYRGGGELDSRWTVQLQFQGLEAGARYVVVVQGRFGAADAPRGDEFTELCSLRASAAGEGGCWWYLVQMQQLNVVQLRRDTLDGPAIAQATRAEGGPGSISSTPNTFSPAEAESAGSPGASPAASPAPAGSPVAS